MRDGRVAVPAKFTENMLSLEISIRLIKGRKHQTQNQRPRFRSWPFSN